MNEETFDYVCPWCGEKYVGVHDLNKEKCTVILECDDCGKKYKLASKAVVNIEVDVKKVD
jgi:transcription elongation factor Elf1